MSNYSWDEYFLDIAKTVSKKSKDPSTKVGAVIVRPDKTVASTGFNGFPRNIIDLEERYNDREMKLKIIQHAEVNASIFAKESIEGYTLYTWPFMPCDRCMLQMIQHGIKRIVFPTPTPEQAVRWAPAFEISKRYAAEAWVDLTEIAIEQ